MGWSQLEKPRGPQRPRARHLDNLRAPSELARSKQLDPTPSPLSVITVGNSALRILEVYAAVDSCASAHLRPHHTTPRKAQRSRAPLNAAMSTLVEQTKARKDYHAKWDAIATEEVQKVEDEDELDKQASSLSLGTDRGPKSEAEAKDKATNKALREAKALWEKRRDEEKKQKLIIKGETKTVVVDQKLLGDALVVDIQECKKAVVTLIPGLKVAKVFVSQCEDVVVEVRCPLITSFVEVSRCTKTTLITSKVLHTVQCDLCDDCSIIWATKECFTKRRIRGVASTPRRAGGSVSLLEGARTRFESRWTTSTARFATKTRRSRSSSSSRSWSTGSYSRNASCRAPRND